MTPGVVRGKLLNKLADLIEENAAEFAALEALDVGSLGSRLGNAVTYVLPQAKSTRKLRAKTSGVRLPSSDTMLAGRTRFRERPLR
jgi:acyl-CoA reductase-like NAD-dependent aldehyde dehydrogenase